MMIKVNGEFLDFDGELEIERQAKFFDNKSTTSGDFSYQGELPNTSSNCKKLQFPFPDNITKIVYTKIAAQILSNNGDVLFYGYLRIEHINSKIITFSFFSGNNNWMSLLNDNLTVLDFSEYDVDLTSYNLAGFNNCVAESGIVFPLIDNGALITRSEPRLLIEDLTAGIYVKTVIKKIFTRHGIKIQGELFDDKFYNGLITLTNNKSQEDIDQNSCFVQRLTVQSTRPNASYTRTKILFDNDSSGAYFNNGNFDIPTSKFTAPIGMIVTIEATLKYNCANVYKSVSYVKNNSLDFLGVPITETSGFITNANPQNAQYKYSLEEDTISITARQIKLLPGDYIEIYGNTDINGCTSIITGTLKITPTYLYAISGVSLVPKWTQQKYVDNIFRLFNVITSYDPISSTLTVDFFNRIKQKQPIDISKFVTSVETDYVDFISNYAIKNILSYNEVDFSQDVKDYNIRKYFKYGTGVINTANEFLENQNDLVTSDFSNPLSYLNGVFGGMSIEKTDLIEINQGQTIDASITNLAGMAKFNIAENIFNIGDLVRVSESSDPLSYEGEWVVFNKAPGYVILYGVGYVTNETCRMTQLYHSYSNSDNTYILYNIPCYDTEKFSTLTQISIGNVGVSSYPLAYFNLLNVGLQINEDYKQSLSFGPIDNELFYQYTLIDTFWGIVFSILNDPAKILCRSNLPYKEFVSIDFLRPFFVKIMETSNLYYLNRITGYKNSSEECILDLIKL